jgi:hypothetical protein
MMMKSIFNGILNIPGASQDSEIFIEVKVVLSLAMVHLLTRWTLHLSEIITLSG